MTTSGKGRPSLPKAARLVALGAPPLPSLSKARGGGRCEVELPELTELLSWFLRGAAVWGILGPTVLGLSRFQQHLVHQLLDRE